MHVSNYSRFTIARIIVGLIFTILFARAFYWQVLASAELRQLATTQRTLTTYQPAKRGLIYASDGFPLVQNQDRYVTFAYQPDLIDPPSVIASLLAPILAPTPIPSTESSNLQDPRILIADTEASLSASLASDRRWIPLNRTTTPAQKEAIQALNLTGIGFDPYLIRDYPEASLAAQLIGFVGSDGTGFPKGYFGLEGFYDFEITGVAGQVLQEQDALGRPIITGSFSQLAPKPGRNLITHLNRPIQYMIERWLEKGLERTGARAGEVLLLDPHTGGIMAMVALPSYDPVEYKEYPQATYAIPSIAESYEPGSTFKALIMAAAINDNLISPDTICDQTCDGPLLIGGYTIKTALNEYRPSQTMAETLKFSDNTGMVFIANKLGVNRLLQYLELYGFGQSTGVDLEGETSPKLRSRWGQIDLATASFGQGIAITSLQMASAFATLATDGTRYQPHVVQAVETPENERINTSPYILNQVLTPATVKTMRQLLIESGHQIAAERKIPKGYKIAGKSGTAQIPIAGHYDQDKTIASFIGYAPAHDPQFVLLVKLTEPTSSPWGIETAAPLWYDIATDLFRYLDIAPDPSL